MMKLRQAYTLYAPWVRLRHTAIFARQLRNFLKINPFATRFTLSGSSVLPRKELELAAGSLFRLTKRQLQEKLAQDSPNDQASSPLLTLSRGSQTQVDALRVRRQESLEAMRQGSVVSNDFEHQGVVERWWEFADDCFRSAIWIAQQESGYVGGEFSVALLGGAARRLNIFTDLDYVIFCSQRSQEAEKFGETLAGILESIGFDSDNLVFRYSRGRNWTMVGRLGGLPHRVFFDHRVLYSTMLPAVQGEFLQDKVGRLIDPRYLNYALWHFMYAVTKRREKEAEEQGRINAALVSRKFFMGMQLLSLREGTIITTEEFSRLAGEMGIANAQDINHALDFWMRLRDVIKLFPDEGPRFYSLAMGFSSVTQFKASLFRKQDLLGKIYVEARKRVGHVGWVEKVHYLLDKARAGLRFLADGDLRVSMSK